MYHSKKNTIISETHICSLETCHRVSGVTSNNSYTVVLT